MVVTRKVRRGAAMFFGFIRRLQAGRLIQGSQTPDPHKRCLGAKNSFMAALSLNPCRDHATRRLANVTSIMFRFMRIMPGRANNLDPLTEHLSPSLTFPRKTILASS
jgi:hypothetical protein